MQRPLQSADRLRSQFDTLPSNMRAVALFLLAIITFSFCVALFKYLGQSLHVTQILGLRQVFIIAALIPAIYRASKVALLPKRLDLQLVRSCLVVVGILSGFTAVIELPLATSTTLSFTRTFFITFFAVIILRESIGPRRITAMLFGFVGIVIIARPQDLLEGGLVGVDINILLAVLSACMIAINQVLIRIQSRFDAPALIVSWQAVLVGIAMTPLAYWHWQTPTWEQLGLIALLGLMTSLAQYSAVNAIKLAEATFLAPFDYLRLLVTTALGWVLFSEWPDLYTWLGAAIIFASTLYILRREAGLKKAPPAQVPE